MPCICAGEESYDFFVAAVFDVCINTKWQLAGFIFGWFSIVCWILAQLPQIRLMFCEKKSDGIHPFFASQWLCGDVFNLISIMLLDLYLPQKILAVYYVLINTTMTTQTFYYKNRSNITPLPTKVKIFFEGIAYLLIVLVVVVGVVIIGVKEGKLLEVYPQGYKECSSAIISKTRSIAGDVTGYLTIPFYCSTRPLQIYQNAKRKLVDNLNVAMFILTLGGNSFYFIGIFVSAVTDGQQSLITQLPFIITSVFPFACDVIIVTQYYYYKKKNTKLAILQAEQHNLDEPSTTTGEGSLQQDDQTTIEIATAVEVPGTQERSTAL